MTAEATLFKYDMAKVSDAPGSGADDSLVETVQPQERERVTMPDDIVIVGMACRFPGADTPEQYWLNLLEGSNCCGPVERWPQAPPPSVRGGLLDDVSLFDAGFFRISPREARCMDPQQRIMLEVAYHAIENSGAPPELLRDLDCGVFCASLPGDYKFLFEGERETAYSSHAFLGNANAALAGRLSYFFDFGGPAITVDTACSSSLVALRMACASIMQGDCKAALVGAVSVFATDEIFRFTRQANILSPAGRCSAFGSQADGFVPAEGAAALIVTTAVRAAQAGLRVLGSVAAIGINHDGNSQGLMAPNPAAQEELIVRTFQDNVVPVGRVGYVEAHGTGTIVGDRVELDALHRAYDRLGATAPSFLGASKAVIGHTLVCSGLAGVIKALKIFEHNLIPPHPIGRSEVSNGIFILNEASVAWPQDKEFISVSAFGFTGTNGHLVLAKPKPKPEEPMSTAQVDRPVLFPFSANTEAALRKRLEQFSVLAADLPEDRMTSLQATLARGREHHKVRAAVVAGTVDELASGLNALQALPIDKLAGALGGGRLNAVTLAEGWKAWLEAGRPAPSDCKLTRPYPLTLPNYPFERKSYWIGTTPGVPAAINRASGNAATLGPKAAFLQPQDLLRSMSMEAFASEIADRPPFPKSSRTTEAVSTERLLDWVQPTCVGRPLILLPPLNMDASAWTQQLGALRRSGYAPHIAIYPGHAGRSCPLEPFDLERLAEEVATYVRETLGVGSVPVLGWSLGGCLSMTLARLAPEIPSSLILISTAARFEDDVFGRTIDLHQEIRKHATHLELVFGTSGDRGVVERIGAGASMDVLMRYYGLLTSFDAVSSLRHITQPTLIVHGTRDAVISDVDVATLRTIPGASVVEFERHGHFAPLTASRSLNTALLGFLASVDHSDCRREEGT